MASAKNRKLSEVRDILHLVDLTRFLKDSHELGRSGLVNFDIEIFGE
jgi:hypothetical protein